MAAAAQLLKGAEARIDELRRECCNRLLRRQHCSSLCLQSEGHEHVANMASALGHDVVGFLAVFGRHNIRPPHFASKVSYSASPQTFAECSHSAFCCSAAPPYYLPPKNRAEIFLNFERPTFQGHCLFDLPFNHIKKRGSILMIKTLPHFHNMECLRYFMNTLRKLPSLIRIKFKPRCGRVIRRPSIV